MATHSPAKEASRSLLAIADFARDVRSGAKRLWDPCASDVEPTLWSSRLRRA